MACRHAVLPNSPGFKSRRINTCKRVSKQTTSAPPESHSYKKHGGEGTSSKFSLSSSPVARTAPSQLTCPASLTLFCSGACALFRLAEDPISFLFNRFPPLLQKHGGWSS